MKKTALFVCILIMIFISAYCITESFTYDYFGFSKNDFEIIEELDTHGGFHGDGSYYLTLDCSANKEKALENISDWHQLPLSDNLEFIMYGGYHLAEKAKIPKIENGYYRFYDRHSESNNRNDDSELLERHSYNFSFAIYDTDTNKFYYFEFDT